MHLRAIVRFKTMSECVEGFVLTAGDVRQLLDDFPDDGIVGPCVAFEV